jgi:hypothetical protein
MPQNCRCRTTGHANDLRSKTASAHRRSKPDRSDTAPSCVLNDPWLRDQVERRISFAAWHVSSILTYQAFRSSGAAHAPRQTADWLLQTDEEVRDGATIREYPNAAIGMPAIANGDGILAKWVRR